jgi:hypothetical protein
MLLLGISLLSHYTLKDSTHPSILTLNLTLASCRFVVRQLQELLVMALQVLLLLQVLLVLLLSVNLVKKLLLA